MQCATVWVLPGVLADNLFFLFNSVLSAATTGLVARAWPKGVKNAREEGQGTQGMCVYPVVSSCAVKHCNFVADFIFECGSFLIMIISNFSPSFLHCAASELRREFPNQHQFAAGWQRLTVSCIIIPPPERPQCWSCWIMLNHFIDKTSYYSLQDLMPW